MNDLILKWLELARWAPSGGNTQPWRIAIADSGVRIFIDPEQVLSPSAMDKSGVAAAIALGAFAFTLKCAAEIDGYRIVDKKIFEASSVWLGYAEIRFERSASRPFFSETDLRMRETDRLRFSDAAIDPTILARLREIFERTEGLYVLELTADSHPAKSEILKPLATLERVRWQDSELLDAMLDEITFGDEQKTRRIGIPSSQLGASPFDTALLNLIKRFRSLRIGMRVGLESVAVHKALGVLVQKCGALFFVQTQTQNDLAVFSACFRLGEAFQEAWLVAHQSGLGFQPIGLPLVGLAHWRTKSGLRFSARHIRDIESRTNDFRDQFGLDLKQPMIGFRIGAPIGSSGHSHVRTQRKTVAQIVDPR